MKDMMDVEAVQREINLLALAEELGIEDAIHILECAKTIRGLLADRDRVLAQG